MAPMRGERGGSPARGARASLPLPRRLIRQIARHVASSGRSLRRLEVSGRVIDNFDDIENVSDESDPEAPQPAVACGGNAGNLPPADHDDDLTSLSWLQDRNLLRGINLTKGDLEDSRMNGQIDLVKSEPSSTPPPTSRPPSPPRTPCKAPPSPPSPPTVAAHAKPPYSFSCLIFMAIEAAPSRALPVKEIYAWIIMHFPYFRHAPQGWKNSVRHNLSLNKCFHKVAAAPGLGKGSLWTVDPQHRATLLQAFGRQPIPLPSPDTPAPAKNAPDPQLFPFLARRLAGAPPAAAAAAARAARAEPGADEYLAAATVLAMKYGPAVMDQFQEDIDVIKRTQKEQERRLYALEREVRKRNLILFGVEEKETSYHHLEETLLEIVNNIIGVPCAFENIEHVGRLGDKNGSPRPILFGLTTLGMKKNILRNKSNLREFAMCIKQDFPRTVHKIRKPLQNSIKLERAKGRRAVIKYGKLVLLPARQIVKRIGYKMKEGEPLPQMKKTLGNLQSNKRNKLPPAAHLVISRCVRDEHSYSGGFEERRTAEALLNLAGMPSASEPARS